MCLNTVKVRPKREERAYGRRERWGGREGGCEGRREGGSQVGREHGGSRGRGCAGREGRDEDIEYALLNVSNE